MDHRLKHGLPEIKARKGGSVLLRMPEPLARIHTLGIHFRPHTVRIILLGELLTWVVLLRNVVGGQVTEQAMLDDEAHRPSVKCL